MQQDADTKVVVKQNATDVTVVPVLVATNSVVDAIVDPVAVAVVAPAPAPAAPVDADPIV